MCRIEISRPEHAARSQDIAETPESISRARQQTTHLIAEPVVPRPTGRHVFTTRRQLEIGLNAEPQAIVSDRQPREEMVTEFCYRQQVGGGHGKCQLDLRGMGSTSMLDALRNRQASSRYNPCMHSGGRRARSPCLQLIDVLQRKRRARL